MEREGRPSNRQGILERSKKLARNAWDLIESIKPPPLVLDRQETIYRTGKPVRTNIFKRRPRNPKK